MKNISFFNNRYQNINPSSIAVSGDGAITYSILWAVQGKVWELWPPDGVDGLTDEYLERVLAGTCLPHKLTAAAKRLRDLGLLDRNNDVISYQTL